MTVRSILIAAAITASTFAAMPAVAAAQTSRCRAGAYLGANSIPGYFPSVQHLRAVNLPRRTDGYAPRCLVADSIGGLIQEGFRLHRRLPRRVTAMGARWYGGRWRVSYYERQLPHNDGPYYHAVARHGRQRVAMDLYA
jgi:hypothetical protein